MTQTLERRTHPLRKVAVLAATGLALVATALPASAADAPQKDSPDSSDLATTAADSTTVNADAYWLVSRDGVVYTFGGVATYGSLPAGVHAVDLEPTPDDQGYWILGDNGTVYAFGTAQDLGSADTSVFASGEHVASLSGTPSGDGYWIFTTCGRVIAKGDAVFVGDLSATSLNEPVMGSVPTPSGHGYYMVADDGGVFAFGDAEFHGSTGAMHLNQPVVGLTPDPDGVGYWLVAADGGLFAFDAPFAGSIPGVVPQGLNAPIIGAVRYGNAYLMVASDGGVFNFATDLTFQGSLGNQTLTSPIVGLAPAHGTVVGTGDIRVTATWQNTNDVDLWVVTPNGDRIYYAARTDGTGGNLDVDANAGCGPQTTRPVENIFWPTTGAPAGQYTVYANLYVHCGTNALATPVSINITVHGQTVFSGQVTVSTENQGNAYPSAVMVHQFNA